jgi:hypothetical protein
VPLAATRLVKLLTKGGRDLRGQHKITNDLENERKKQAILSLILAVIVIALGLLA